MKTFTAFGMYQLDVRADDEAEAREAIDQFFLDAVEGDIAEDEPQVWAARWTTNDDVKEQM